jgi:hypothetical protein
VRRFQPRFQVWWKNGAQARLQSAAQSMKPFIEARDLTNLLGDVAFFFSSELPDTFTLALDLIALPPGRAGATATQVENHSVIEVPEGDAPANRMPVFVHEIVHYLYAQAPALEHTRIVRFFAGAQEPYALGSYNILNEALATAIGNGLVQRMMVGQEKFAPFAAQPRSFYNDEFIDRAGKALLPITESALRAGGKLDAEFLRAYLAAIPIALGPRSTSPLLTLKHIAAFDASPTAGKARRKLTDAIRPGSMYAGPSAFGRYPKLGGVVFALSGDLNNPELGRLFGAAAVQQVRAAAARSRGVVFGSRRAGGAPVYWFVGREAADLERLVDAFVRRTRRLWEYVSRRLPAIDEAT